MRLAWGLALVLAAGCASSQRRAGLQLPPEATYSPAAGVAGVAGIAASAAGSEMTRSDRSSRTRKAGNAAVAGGAALMGIALWDAVRVDKEIRKLRTTFDYLTRTRPSPAADGGFEAPPPPPEPSFEFVEDPLDAPPVRP